MVQNSNTNFAISYHGLLPVCSNIHVKVKDRSRALLGYLLTLCWLFFHLLVSLVKFKIVIPVCKQTNHHKLFSVSFICLVSVPFPLNFHFNPPFVLLGEFVYSFFQQNLIAILKMWFKKNLVMST